MAGSKSRYPGVYRRGKVWAYRAQFDDGGQRWGVSGSGYASAKEANDARLEHLRKAKPLRYRARPDATVTLGEYLSAWLEDHTRVVRPATASAYRSRAQVILDHPIAGKRLRSLTEPHFRTLIHDIRAAGASHATLMAKVQMLNTAMNAAVRAGTIPENPLARITVSRTSSKFEPVVWQVDEAQRFLAHRKAAQDPLFLCWHLALVTGLRKGELHGIRREDLDLEHGVLHVRRQRTQVRGQVIEQAPKTSSSEAPVFLDPGTVELIRQHVWTSEYLITDPRTGAPYRHMSLFHGDWKRACVNAGVPAIRFHDLRHTSASFLAAAGVPIILAKERLRHWSTSMTARYQHALNSMGAQVAGQIGAFLEEPEAS